MKESNTTPERLLLRPSRAFELADVRARLATYSFDAESGPQFESAEQSASQRMDSGIG